MLLAFCCCIIYKRFCQGLAGKVQGRLKHMFFFSGFNHQQKSIAKVHLEKKCCFRLQKGPKLLLFRNKLLIFYQNACKHSIKTLEFTTTKRLIFRKQHFYLKNVFRYERGNSELRGFLGSTDTLQFS